MLPVMSYTRHNGGFDAVALVGSQGALSVARTILGSLPPDFPAAVIYVQHRVATAGHVLAEIVRRWSELPVASVVDGDAVEPGAIYVAPPEAQTVVGADRRFALREGRCAGDPLLSSVADVYGSRSIAVILSGRLADGAVGVRHVKEAGGRGLVQAPRSAEAPAMPLAAMATGCYDFALTPQRIADALVAFVMVRGAADLLGVRSHPLVTTGPE